MKYRIYYTIVFLFLFISAEAQVGFQIEDGKKSFRISFELVNDLVILPVEINGLELSFLLDTGVNSTILFSLDEKDSINIKNAEIISLRGLGEGKPFQAIKSTGNLVRIGEAYSTDLPLYVVYDNPINLSNRIGVPIHGIIGYDFFKDFVLEFNYSRKKLRVSDPQFYKYKNCRRCEDFDIFFHLNKPYINVTASINDQQNLPLNLLIDSGSGDALWVFQNEEKNILVPKLNFEDFLGFGMGGSVYGLRSRVEELKIGKFEFEKVTASFPDTVYFKGIETFESRNGSIGSQILKRFHSTFDYPNQKLRLKPNRGYKKPFEYDMSGVVIAHDGYTVIKDIMRAPGPVSRDDQGNSIVGETVYKSTFEVKFKLEPQFKVVEIRPGSPAALAGLLKDDTILKINGKPAHRFSLAKIAALLSSYNGKKIRLKVERNGEKKSVTFNLERIL